jgi:hypothetical protein
MSNKSENREATFDYIKSNYFRVVFASGMTGGVTPTGDMIQMSVFNERGPIPQTEVFKIAPDGRVGPPVLEKRVARDAIVREVEVTIAMSIEGARAMRDWLDRALKLREQIISNGKEK